jgi:hypothetical protein
MVTFLMLLFVMTLSFAMGWGLAKQDEAAKK